jgi:hypothetical protein
VRENFRGQNHGGGPRITSVPPVPKLSEGTDVQKTLNIAVRSSNQR